DSSLKGGVEANVFWAFSGKLCRFDVIYDPELERASVQHLGPGMIRSSWFSYRSLTDGEKSFVLRVHFSNEQGEVQPGVEQFLQCQMRPPLALGFPTGFTGADNLEYSLSE